MSTPRKVVWKWKDGEEWKELVQLHSLTLCHSYPQKISEYIEEHKHRGDTTFRLPHEFRSKTIDLDRLVELDTETKQERTIRSVHKKVPKKGRRRLTSISGCCLLGGLHWKRYMEEVCVQD
jgi:hypothetical protein